MVSRRLHSLRASIGLGAKPGQAAEAVPPAAHADEAPQMDRPTGPACGQAQDPPEQAAPATIHKGAYVVVRLYLEGDQPPAEDFAQTATGAARAVFDAGIAAQATPLTATIKQIRVDDDPPDADEPDDSGDRRS